MGMLEDGDMLEDGNMLEDESLDTIGQRLLDVPGVLAVALGGSRARGDHTPASDIDLGIYYEGDIDDNALAALAQELGGQSATVTAIGGWGPWVDGGGWLNIDGVAVDWIYRDIHRTEASVAAAERGETTRHYQLGHPFGIPQYAYAAEIALARIIADPDGRLGSLKERLREYPSQLSMALISDLADADFNIAIARKAVSRLDPAYISGCLFHALIVAANAIHAAAGRWVTNEKGAVILADALPTAPAGFAERSARVAGSLGRSETELERTIDEAAAIVADTRASIVTYAR